jgi:energy-coupling factor transporter ATP-binding protein EcfA2
VTVTLPTEVESVSWSEFLDRFEWYQGEHLTLIGPTKSGKTTLARELLRRARKERTHPWQTIVATKRRDEILDTFKPDGFVKLPSWIVHDAEVHPKVMLAPPLPSAAQKGKQAAEIREALTSIYRQGGWLVFLDELKHIAAYLGLEPEVELLLHQGRSAGITVVCAVQRPRHVPLMAYDQADHIFMWESRDFNIRKRLGEIGGKVNPDLIEYGLKCLPTRHSFLYINPASGEVIQSEVEL